MLLQKTWIHKNSNVNLEIKGFNCEHLFGNKSTNMRRGRYSGGLSLYFKKHLRSFITVVEKIQSGLMIIRLSKELFHFNENVFMLSVYIPPSGSNFFNRGDDEPFEQLELCIEKYKPLGKLFILGDMNARTHDLNDYFDGCCTEDTAHRSAPVDNVVDRANQDHVTDTHGRRLISLCIETGLCIGNGRLKNDTEGKVTYYSRNGASLIDYLLLSKNDFKHIKEFDVNFQIIAD